MLKQCEDRLWNHLAQVTPETQAECLRWYEKAHNECKLLADVFDISLNKVVGIVAALSPRNRWASNLSNTWDILETPSMSTRVGTFNKNKEKALAIHALDNTRLDDIPEILKGRKVTNFYYNILNYDTSTCVTVDVWAFRSVELEQLNKHYSTVEQAYKNVAKELGWLPWQVQAVVWGHIRGKVGA